MPFCLLVPTCVLPRDHHDRTPLHLAASKGSELCVEYILEAHPESLNALDKYQVTEVVLVF